jgi:glyoxylase-like metal-dependent hydrolase (beta-lactamase superfamily II)
MSSIAENVAPDIYRIEVPLTGNPLKSINSYVIKSPERNLIIDTAFNRPDCLKQLQLGFRELDVDPEKADYFVTHRHADHHGLITTLAGESSRVYVGRIDLEFIQKAGYGGGHMLEQAPRHGFAREEIQKMMGTPPASPDSKRIKPNYVPLDDGDSIDIGRYAFKCLSTPGHSQGHVVLHDPEAQIMVTGDHVLGTITPNISGWFQQDSPLHDYLSSLDKIYPLAVKLVLPGHRAVFDNFRERIDEIRQHHVDRNETVLKILEGGPQNGYQMASQMPWDLHFPSWDDFPKVQQWFATGEALAHLIYLEREGRVKSSVVADVVYFELA